MSGQHYSNGQRFWDAFVAATAVGLFAFSAKMYDTALPATGEEWGRAVLLGFALSSATFGLVHVVYGTTKMWFEEVVVKHMLPKPPKPPAERRPVAPVVEDEAVADDDDDSNEEEEADLMEGTGGNGHVLLVNQWVPSDCMLVRYRQEIQTARAAGHLQVVTVNKVDACTSLKKWPVDKPATRFVSELKEKKFIDAVGNWTETGRAYSLPHPNRLPAQSNNNRLQPVG